MKVLSLLFAVSVSSFALADVNFKFDWSKEAFTYTKMGVGLGFSPETMQCNAFSGNPDKGQYLQMKIAWDQSNFELLGGIDSGWVLESDPSQSIQSIEFSTEYRKVTVDRAPMLILLQNEKVYIAAGENKSHDLNKWLKSKTKFAPNDFSEIRFDSKGGTATKGERISTSHPDFGAGAGRMRLMVAFNLAADNTQKTGADSLEYRKIDIRVKTQKAKS